MRDVGLAEARDREVWDYASESGAVIVSKDSDFDHFSFLYGAPPKVIWLRCGNCSTDDLAQLVRTHAAKIGAFGRDLEAALLVLPPAAFGNSSRTP